MSTTQPTLAARLDALVALVAPEAVAHYAAHGGWPTPEGGRPAQAGPPYVIETLPSGSRRIRLTGDEGDVVTGTGATLAEAVSALEAKLR